MRRSDSFFDASANNVDIDFRVAFFDQSRRGAARRRQRRGRGEGRAQVIRIGSIAFLLCAAAVLQVSPAFAQPANRAPFRFEGGVGIVWDGAQSLGTRDRDGDDRLRRHARRCSARRASSAVPPASTAASACGCHDRFVVEAEASYLKPQLRIAISATPRAPRR